MPTLRNDGHNVHVIERIDGAICPVGFGDTIETYDASAASLTGMTQTSAAPYYNPALLRSDLTSTGPGDDKTVSLDSESASVEIINNSSSTEITVFLDSTLNTPGLKVVAGSRRTIDGLQKRAANIVLQFSAAVSAGECYVTQLR